MPEAKSSTSLVERALLGVAAIVFTSLMRYHAHNICDDAFISFRYAAHLLAGAGPLWNSGERVEGFSSPLWLGLLAIGGAIGVPLPAWATALGVLFAALGLIVLHGLARSLSSSRLVAAAAVLGAALLYPLYYWSPAGLETALFAALITAGALSIVNGPAWMWAATGALLGVSRPEGPGLTAVLAALVAVVRGRAMLRPRLLLVALGPTVLWQVFRLAYFGAWLPNTVAAKAGGDWGPRLVAGVLYAAPALGTLAVTVVAIAFGALARRAAVAALTFVAVCLGVVVFAGGDWMWHGRMVLPVLPALLALTCAAVASAPLRHRVVLVVVCALGWVTWLPSPHILADALTGGRLPPAAFQEGTLVAANQAAAAYIAEHYRAEDLVAVNHAGALPYALPNPALDMAGLCDRHIARDVAGSLHQKFDAAYVLARRPRLVVLNSRTRPGTAGVWYHPGYWQGETALIDFPGFAARYRPVGTYWAWQWQTAVGGGYVLLYERVD